MTLSDIKKIKWRQRKYVFPLILYAMMLGTGWLFFDMFHTEKADGPSDLQTTQYLNPELPAAHLRDEAIGGKYENMAKSYGRINDYTAVDNIEQTEMPVLENYDSQYTEAELAMLDAEAERQLRDMQEALERSRDSGLAMREDETMSPLTDAERAAMAAQREQEALDELNRALAEARLQGGRTPETSEQIPLVASADGEINLNGDAVTQLPYDAESQEVVKVKRPNSSYFNTLTENEVEPRLIKAIIDEDVKAVDGSRVRLRLLDDVEINGTVLSKGNYMYATMSGFGQQRVKGSVKSLMVDDRLLKVDLALYDTDGLEGLYVPESAFREASKEVAASAVSGNVPINSGMSNSFAQWGVQTAQNAFNQVTGALSKSIRKNKAKLKYGTFVYLVNSRETY